MTQLFGYSPYAPDQVLEEAIAGRVAPGDWVVATDGVVVSSPVAAVPYFVTAIEGELAHGPDLFALAAARRDWQWNLLCLRDMVWQGHASGTHTIHAGIHRMPSDATASIRGGTVVFEERGYWGRATPKNSLGAAVEAMQAALAELSGRPLVSLSGGFDSRLLLAAVLASGAEPRVAVMGPPGSSDRTVAEALAARFALNLEVVEVPAASYLAVGPSVARLTGGAKLASNWHTYHYAQAVAHTGPHVVGANGEFARSFYLKGKPSARVANALPGRAAVGLYFAARAALRRRRAPSLVAGTPSALVAYAGQQARHASRRVRGLDSLDVYYATQRVRQLIGDGMALYRASGEPVSPFLDVRWLDAVRGLDRRYKLGDRYHRDAMRQLLPDVLAVPFGGDDGPPYSPWRAAVSDPAAVDAVIESAELDEIWTREQRRVAASSPNALDLLHTVRAAIAVRDGT